MAKIINLINDREPKDFVERLIERSATNSRHVNAWLRSTFMRWLRKQPQHLRLVVTGQMKMAMIDNGIIDSSATLATFHVDTLTNHGDWAVNALLRGQLYMFVLAYSSDSGVYLHMVDYLQTLPDKPIHKSVEQVEKEVAAWDIKLREQKLKGDLNCSGVVEVWTDPTGKYRVCRLESIDAFTAEASYMGNCLITNGYHTATGLSIYSLRDVKTGFPIADIRVDDCTFYRVPQTDDSVEQTTATLDAALRYPDLAQQATAEIFRAAPIEAPVEEGFMRRLFRRARPDFNDVDMRPVGDDSPSIGRILNSMDARGMRIRNVQDREWEEGFSLVNVDGRFNHAVDTEVRLAAYAWFIEAFGDRGVNLNAMSRDEAKRTLVRTQAKFVKFTLDMEGRWDPMDFIPRMRTFGLHSQYQAELVTDLAEERLQIARSHQLRALGISEDFFEHQHYTDRLGGGEDQPDPPENPDDQLQ